MAAPRLRAKRIYDAAGPDDGLRVLVDRLWPRGVSRGSAALDLWMRQIAPSNELRRWYGHAPERAQEFARRYRVELEARRAELDELRKRARRTPVTLLYAARSFAGSNAEALLAILRQPGPTRTGPRPRGKPRPGPRGPASRGTTRGRAVRRSGRQP